VLLDILTLLFLKIDCVPPFSELGWFYRSLKPIWLWNFRPQTKFLRCQRIDHLNLWFPILLIPQSHLIDIELRWLQRFLKLQQLVHRSDRFVPIAISVGHRALVGGLSGLGHELLGASRIRFAAHSLLKALIESLASSTHDIQPCITLFLKVRKFPSCILWI
jgi:hypothetical protein